ncbi:MAG: hypothetical protein RL742_1336, partial [Bacteroidota bacterium]
MLYEFRGYRPVVHESAFIHPQATVTGHVIIGRDVYVGPGAAIRGDWGRIIIEDGCNVQENCTIHMFPGVTVYLRAGAHIGHGAVVHGADIGRDSLIGMNSVIMDEVEIGEECIIGALCFIKAGEKIPRRSLVVGNPGKIIREVSEEMISWKTEGTRLYQQLPAQCYETLRPCEPLREAPADMPDMPDDYKIGKNKKRRCGLGRRKTNVPKSASRYKVETYLLRIQHDRHRAGIADNNLRVLRLRQR